MRRYSHIFLLTIVLLAVLLSSCRKGNLAQRPGPQEEDPTITFSMVVPGAAIPDLTKGLELNGQVETHIETVEVFQFDGNTLAHYARGYDITSGSNGSRKFSAKVLRGTYDMVVLANVRESVESAYPSGAGLQAGSTTRAEIEQALTVSHSGKWYDTGDSPTSRLYFPMYGEAKSLPVSEAIDTYPDIRMHRMHARVDVQVSDAVDEQFMLHSVYVYYRSSSGRIIPASGNWDRMTQKATAPSIPASSGVLTTPLLYDHNAPAPSPQPTAPGASYIGDIYLFETSAADSPVLLVLRGQDRKTAAEVFHCLELTDGQGTPLSLLRNHRYNLTVSSFRHSGYTSADEAAANPPGTVAELEVLDDEFDYVVYNSHYFLAMSPMVYTVASDDQMSNEVDVFKIITNYGWWSYTYEYDGNQSGWLYEYEDWESTPWAPSYEPEVAHAYTGKTALRFTVYPNSGAERKMFFTFRAGTLVVKATLVQQAGNSGPGT